MYTDNISQLVHVACNSTKKKYQDSFADQFISKLLQCFLILILGQIYFNIQQYVSYKPKPPETTWAHPDPPPPLKEQCTLHDR